MDRIRVQNLRCLVGTPQVEIKPITLLVGANSSGKSTFLRVFPLLKQSAETRTLSGILLNEGDVNFGFFQEALHKSSTPQQLRFAFSLTLRRGIHQGAYTNRFLSTPLPLICEVGFASRAIDGRYPFLKSVALTLEKDGGTDTIQITADEDGKVASFQVNEYMASSDIAHIRLRVGRSVIPTLASIPPGEFSGEADDDDDDYLDAGPFEKKLLAETSNMFHGRTTRANRLTVLRGIRLDSPAAMLRHAQSLGGGTSWHNNAAAWTVTSRNFITVRNLIVARHVGDILSGVNRYVTALSESVHYFQPVRASVQRDYASRDVAVSSVDATGNNVAMVLTSLREPALAAFRSWLRQHFGFEVYPATVGDGARVALRMKEVGSDTDFNLADMGFGFSQMLPFLVQIWYVIESDQESDDRAAIPKSFIVAIEQPELHLHPGLQSKLADLFVNVVRVSRDMTSPIRFMLETHSPTIIERIGAHVEADPTLQNDVQVLLFERGNEQSANTARVRITGYDETGILQEWPFGFLSPLPSAIERATPNPVQS